MSYYNTIRYNFCLPVLPHPVMVQGSPTNELEPSATLIALLPVSLPSSASLRREMSLG